ncbi:MarR family winged helix-turn-helix transcriptional regulator [Altericroceibacterium endophyticum]|nr:MarR family winged helix-turn-helix transcriptional regulator [Altericroceibacterium endophyticum]
MEIFLGKPGFLLARIDQIATALFNEADCEATLPQSEFLLLIDRLGPSPQVTLGRAAGVDKSTTAYICDNLVARGWVERRPCREDRRRALITFTDAGLAQLPSLRRAFLRLQHQLTAPLKQEDAHVLVDLLHRVARHPTDAAPTWLPACDPQTGVLDLAPTFLMRRALQLYHANFLSDAAAFNLTLRQFSLLFLLLHRPHLTQTGFARLFGLDPSTCAVIMKGLARRKLIAGQRSPEDGRATVYRLTDAGAAALDGVKPLADKSQRVLTDCMSAERVEWLIGQLRTLVHAHSDRLRYPGAIALIPAHSAV